MPLEDDDARVGVARLPKLFATRSALTTAMMAYLHGVIGFADEDSLSKALGQRNVSEMYVWPDVYDRVRGEAQDQRISWDSALKRIDGGNAIAILGAAGEGKTILGRMTSRRLAITALHKLEEFSCNVESLEIPLWLNLDSISRIGFADAVAAHAKRMTLGGRSSALFRTGFDAAKRVNDVLRAAIRAGRVWVFLDDLDEVTNHHRLRNELTELIHSGCRVVVTSRLYRWNTGTFPVSFVNEYELADLHTEQCLGFAAEWFKGQPQHQAEASKLLSSASNLAGLARNAQLLTLICHALRHLRVLDPENEDKDSLYRRILRDLLSEHGKPHHTMCDSADVDLLFLILRRMAGTLMAENSQRAVVPYEIFRDHLVRAIESTRTSYHVDAIQNKLERCGVIVQRDGQWSFLHRAFMEFCERALKPMGSLVGSALFSKLLPVQANGHAFGRLSILSRLVKVAEFQEFIDHHGYRRDEFWLHDGPIETEIRNRGRPRNWSEGEANTDAPVRGCTWYEALAFVKWLTKINNRKPRIHLPRAFELHAAANERVIEVTQEGEWSDTLDSPDFAGSLSDVRASADRKNVSAVDGKLTLPPPQILVIKRGTGHEINSLGHHAAAERNVSFRVAINE